MNLSFYKHSFIIIVIFFFDVRRLKNIPFDELWNKAKHLDCK